MNLRIVWNWLRNLLWKFIYFCADNKWRVFRFFVLLVLSLLIYFYIFDGRIRISTDDLNHMRDSQQNAYVNISTTTVFLDRSRLSPSDLGTILWKSLYGFEPTKVCFGDKGSYAVESNKMAVEETNKTHKITTEVVYNGKTFKVGRRTCRPLLKGAKNFTFSWKFTFPISSTYDYSKAERIPVGNESYRWKFAETVYSLQTPTQAYIEPPWWIEWAKFLLIFFSLGAVLWAWWQTVLIIRDGLD